MDEFQQETESDTVSDIASEAGPDTATVPSKSSRKLRFWHKALIGLAVFTAVSWYVHRPDERARQLNEVLEEKASADLKAYPYQFRVLRTVGGTAVLTTPRNVDVPAFKMIAALHPDINVRDPNDPAFIAAQQTLAAVQSEAREIVQSQPGITGVSWELDKSWLRSQGIEIPEDIHPRQ